MLDILLSCFQNTALLNFMKIPFFCSMRLQKFEVILSEIKMHRLRKIFHKKYQKLEPM